jgi:hypothetical protein
MMLFVVLLAFLVTGTVAQLNISTPPSLAQCQAWTITWTGGIGESYPYLLSIDVSPVLRIHLPRVIS